MHAGRVKSGVGERDSESHVTGIRCNEARGLVPPDIGMMEMKWGLLDIPEYYRLSLCFPFGLARVYDVTVERKDLFHTVEYLGGSRGLVGEKSRHMSPLYR